MSIVNKLREEQQINLYKLFGFLPIWKTVRKGAVTRSFLFNHIPVAKTIHTTAQPKRKSETICKKETIVKHAPTPDVLDIFCGAVKITKTNDVPEVVIIIPVIHPDSFSGGPNTALLFAAEIAKLGYAVHAVSLGEPCCSDEVLRNHLRNELHVDPTVVQRFRVSKIDDGITIHANDKILATRYDTAVLAQKLTARMNNTPFMYIIQDFEPMFYEWNELHALAISSYDTNFFPVINESLLKEFFGNMKVGRFAEESFRKTALSFQPAVDQKFFYPEERRTEKQTLLFYARPQAPRNLFQHGLQAIYQLVQDGTITADQWEVHCIGFPTLPAYDLGHGMVTKTLPWMSFTKYAACVRQCSVGLSLMLSPHTSYTPLELAACDTPVVTNTYVSKTANALQDISPHIIGVRPIVEDVAEGLRKAVERAVAPTTEPHHVFPLPATWPEAFAPIMPAVLEYMES